MAETALPAKEPETQRTPARGAESGSPFDTLRREIDRIFDDFRPMGLRWPFRRGSAELELPWPDFGAARVAPAMDLAEHDGGWELTVELPGLEEKDVEIRLTDGALTIRGEKSEESERKDRQYYLCERRFGAFQRSLQLPQGVDRDRIEASFAKGVLKVTLPKSAEARATERKIEIQKA